MKNINKYRTPQDKMEAWKDWCCSKSGCCKCVEKQGYLNWSTDCNMEDMCFNAWLHSTTKEKKGK